MPFKIVRNDITKMTTEAIVNTANEKPTVGTGCDFAVYNAAGYDELLSWRKKYIGTVEEGEAFISPGFRLPAKYIIHTVSPLYIDGEHGEEELLRSCYRKSLALAAGYGIRSIAFPLISTGGFGYPKEEGMRIAVDEIHAFLLKSDMQIFLVVFDERATRMGRSLYPDLEAYIDRNYVQEKRTEEYGDAFFAAHEAREGASSEVPFAAREAGEGAFPEVPFAAREAGEEASRKSYYAAYGGGKDASNQINTGGLAAPGKKREKRENRRKPGLFERLKAARRKDAGKGEILSSPSAAGPADEKESLSQPFTADQADEKESLSQTLSAGPADEKEFLPLPSAVRPPYSEETYPEASYLEACPGASYLDDADYEAPDFDESDSEEMYGTISGETALEDDDAILELERRLAERMAHMSDTFPEYLLYLIRKNGLDNADVYKRAIVDKKVFSKIKNNPDYHPKKLTALCLCVGAKLNIDETRDLLARAGYALSPCDKTDIIFSYFIEHRIYDMIELDIQLEEHGLPCIIA